MALQIYLSRKFVCILASSTWLCKKTSHNANRTFCKVDGGKHGKQFGRSLDIRKSISCSCLFQPVLSKLLQMVCLAKKLYNNNFYVILISYYLILPLSYLMKNYETCVRLLCYMFFSLLCWN